MIEIIPAIDIIGGECVRLTKGDYNESKVYYRDPLDAAKSFEGVGLGRLHLVDLDGARDEECRNLRVLERIAGETSLVIDYSGGIRSGEAISNALDAGAAMVGVGSVAARTPELFAEWLEEFGGERMVLGVDERDGKVAVKGWLETADCSVEDVIGRFIGNGLRKAVCTDISRDGMLCGPSVEFYTGLQTRFPEVDITVSGGISSMADIEALDAAGLRSVIVGKAIYEGKITLKEIELCLQKG